MRWSLKVNPSTSSSRDLMAGNKIPNTQEAPAQIKLLRARKHTYALADRLFVAQLILSVALPVIGGGIAAVFPVAKPWVAALALATIVLDALLIDRYLKALLKRGAIIGEQFDCIVLELAWDQFSVGDKIDPEDIHRAARAYSSKHDDSAIIGWYPKEVGDVPLHVGRVICQRTNLRYDSSLRRRYGTYLVQAALALVGAFFLIGLTQDSTITGWVLTMAPATPLLAWAARECHRQGDAAASLETLKKQADGLLDRVMADDCSPDDCGEASREFQSAIFLRRAANPLIIPSLYAYMRPQLEDEMKVAAEQLVERYKRSRKGRR